MLGLHAQFDLLKTCVDMTESRHDGRLDDDNAHDNARAGACVPLSPPPKSMHACDTTRWSAARASRLTAICQKDPHVENSENLGNPATRGGEHAAEHKPERHPACRHGQENWKRKLERCGNALLPTPQLGGLTAARLITPGGRRHLGF